MSCLFQEGEHGLDEHKLHMYLSALQSLIPSLFALVLQNAPFASKAKLQGEVPQIEGKWWIYDKWNFGKRKYNSMTNLKSVLNAKKKFQESCIVHIYLEFSNT